MYRLKKYTIIFALFAGLVPSIIGAVESPSFEEALKALCTQYGRPIDENTFKTFLENHAPETQKTSETSEKSLVPFETIEILSYNPKETEDVPQNITSVYQDCFGEGRLFRIVSEEERQDEWREEAITKMQGFGEALRNLGVKQNPLIASFYFYFDDEKNYQTRMTLPRIFFSGIYKDLKNSIALEPSSAFKLGSQDLAHFNFIKNDMKLLIEERSLKKKAEVYFGANTEFFVTEFKGPCVIFTQGDNHTAKDIKSALRFREFIYEHFSNLDQTKEPNKENSKQYETYQEEILNIISYGKDSCGVREESDIDKRVLDLALKGMRIKEIQKTHLKHLFGKKEDFNFFNFYPRKEKSKKSEKEEGKESDGMNYCFHQSEQALLRYILEESKDSPNRLTEFSAILVGFIKNYIMSNIEGLLSSKAVYLVSSQISEDKPDNNIQKPEALSKLDDLVSRTSPLSISRPASELDTLCIKKLDINLDLLSTKHICVFCRGTLACSYKRLCARIGTLVNSAIVSTEDKRNSSFLNSLQEKYERQKISKILKLKIDNGVKLNKIYASSYDSIQPPLMGKKNIEKEVSHENL